MPRNLTRKTFIVVGIAAVIYIGAGLLIGWHDIAGALSRIGPGRFAAVVGLSLVNYGLRFWRWHDFLAIVGVHLPLGVSARIYFATYVMVITPGKVGEVFKAGILRDAHAVPLSRGVPAVMAERIYDFLAVLALLAGGMFFWNGPFQGAHLGLTLGLAFAGVLLLVRSTSVRRRLVEAATRRGPLAGHTVHLDDALAATSSLLSPGRGAGYLMLSTAAWFCECAGMWLVCHVLAPTIGLGDAVFVYAAATLVGSVSFLPGGLGGTEAIIIVLLGSMGTASASAAAVAFIVRLATLWLAVVVGVVVYASGRKQLLSDCTAADTTP